MVCFLLFKVLGKEKKRRELIRDLDSIYEEIVRMFCVSQGDFPEIDQFRHARRP